MKILAIDTSCDETAAAVTEDLKILSNIVWSQAAAHAKFGGVMPSLAQRMHEERIDWVINKALKTSGFKIEDLDAVAVTIGPGLSIALGVGIDRAKKLAKKYGKPLIRVNHIEAHLLSCLANSDIKIKFPAYGLVVSGGNTVFVLISKIGDYKILAETHDDALGEALDKGARMLGLGYPGGAILEKIAKQGNPDKIKLPIPLLGQEGRRIFSYSGLKTSFYRLIESHKSEDPDFPSRQDIYNLAASFQDTAFKHIERVVGHIIADELTPVNYFLLGGGVAANSELKKRLRKLGREFDFKLFIPYSKKIYGDNAAMIGTCAFLNQKYTGTDEIDRIPRLKLGMV